MLIMYFIHCTYSDCHYIPQLQPTDTLHMSSLTPRAVPKMKKATKRKEMDRQGWSFPPQISKDVTMKKGLLFDPSDPLGEGSVSRKEGEGWEWSMRLATEEQETWLNKDTLCRVTLCSKPIDHKSMCTVLFLLCDPQRQLWLFLANSSPDSSLTCPNPKRKQIHKSFPWEKEKKKGNSFRKRFQDSSLGSSVRLHELRRVSERYVCLFPLQWRVNSARRNKKWITRSLRGLRHSSLSWTNNKLIPSRLQFLSVLCWIFDSVELLITAPSTFYQFIKNVPQRRCSGGTFHPVFSVACFLQHHNTEETAGW